MLVNGFDSEPPSGTKQPFESGVTALTQHRYTLGKDTLLCLFEGSIKSVEIYLHPETIHYGIDFEAEEKSQSPCYVKYLRDANGNPVQPTVPPCGSDRSKDYVENQWVRIPFRYSNCSVVDISALSNRFASVLSSTSISPAEFALQMVEGVPKVRFTMVSNP